MPNRKNKPNEFALGIFLLSSLGIAAAALVLFGWLAEKVMKGDATQFDAAIRTAIHNHAAPFLTTIMQAFSFLGSVTWVTSFGAFVVCVCLYFKRRRMAGFLAIAMVGAATLDYVLKLAFHRLRPIAYYGVSPRSYSFPSGHALGSLCFYGILAAVLTDRMASRKQKFFIWLFASLLVTMIGFSRIYLGVHYPSDVIAGYLAGAVWVTAVTIVDEILLDRCEKKISLANILPSP